MATISDAAPARRRDSARSSRITAICMRCPTAEADELALAARLEEPTQRPRADGVRQRRRYLQLYTGSHLERTRRGANRARCMRALRACAWSARAIRMRRTPLSAKTPCFIPGETQRRTHGLRIFVRCDGTMRRAPMRAAGWKSIPKRARSAMSHNAAILEKPVPRPDYSLTGVNCHAGHREGAGRGRLVPVRGAARNHARAAGAARRAGHPRHDSLVRADPRLGLRNVARCGAPGGPILPYAIYGVLYATTSDSRWHEIRPRHRVQDRLDEQRALRDRLVHGHARVDASGAGATTATTATPSSSGRDPEIAVPRPPNLRAHRPEPSSACGVYPHLFQRSPVRTALGRIPPTEKTFIPESEFPQGLSQRAHLPVDLRGGHRRWRSISAASCRSCSSGCRNLFGTWLMSSTASPQHAGLAENVLDHRLNCRTVYMNPDQPLSVLEHELPRGAPHVPAGAVSRAAQAACGGQETIARTPYPVILYCLARDSSHPAAADEGSRPTT